MFMIFNEVGAYFFSEIFPELKEKNHSSWDFPDFSSFSKPSETATRGVL